MSHLLITKPIQALFLLSTFGARTKTQVIRASMYSLALRSYLSHRALIADEAQYYRVSLAPSDRMKIRLWARKRSPTERYELNSRSLVSPKTENARVFCEITH